MMLLQAASAARRRGEAECRTAAATAGNAAPALGSGERRCRRERSGRRTDPPTARRRAASGSALHPGAVLRKTTADGKTSRSRARRSSTSSVSGDGWTARLARGPDSDAPARRWPRTGASSPSAQQAMLSSGASPTGVDRRRRTGAPSSAAGSTACATSRGATWTATARRTSVIATHDQGVIAVVHPARAGASRRSTPAPHVRARDRVGDVDGDGVTSLRHPERTQQARQGAARRSTHVPPRQEGWQSPSWMRRATPTPRRSSSPTSIATASKGVRVVEGAVGPGGAIVRPVTSSSTSWRDRKSAGTSSPRSRIA